MSEAVLFGFPVFSGSLDDLVARILLEMEAGRTVYHASLNANKLSMCRRSGAFRETLRSFDVLTADGISIVLGARVCGARVHERIPGIDLMARLLTVSEARNLSVYLLGARGPVLERATTAIHRSHSGLRIAGGRDGYFDPAGEDDVVRGVNASGADLLFVGMPSPKKEEFLIRNRSALKVRYAMGVGGAIDVWSGAVRRAPPWVRRCGMEWCYRTVQEPRRLVGRYLRDAMHLATLLAGEIAGRRWREGRE